MKKLLLVSLLALVSTIVAIGQIQVSIDGDYVHFSKTRTKDGTTKTFISSLASPSELVTVHISYPKQDRSEYVITSGHYFPTERDQRYATMKEGKGLAKEWQQIQKQVTFGRIEGSVVVDRMRKYTFIGTTTDDTHRLMHVFKVQYLVTGKEGVAVLDYSLFKIHPVGTEPFYMGREHGKLLPFAVAVSKLSSIADDMSTR